MKILVLGDGLLGSEITKQTHWPYISRKKDGIDFLNYQTYKNSIINCDLVINCIAYTQTYEGSKEKHWKTNFRAVTDLAKICEDWNVKLCHISTDYVYCYSVPNATEEDLPLPAKNWYSYTKLLADEYIQARNNNYLIIRSSFKPKPFPWDFGFMQVGNFMYVDEIAKLIIQLINKNAKGVFNVGRHESWTIYDMAKQTNPNVQPWNNKISDSMPDDISMSVNKMEEFLRD